MNQLTDYIKVYDNVIRPEVCNGLIEVFEKNTPSTNPFYRVSTQEWDEDYRKFTEAEITNIPDFSQFIAPLYKNVQAAYKKYKEDCGRFFPKKNGLENFRLKRYDANNYDQFGWHADVGDYPSARRYLVMFLYLNDVDLGGETQFEFDKDYENSKAYFTVKPKCGRMVLFPPMWMFPHRGCKPISGPKYILSTYAHYL